MGGGGRFPYPKHVWSPAGGWWSRPSNWKANTAVALTMLGVVQYFTFTFSARNERKFREVTEWIPSLHYAEQFKDKRFDKFRNGTYKEGDVEYVN